MAYTGFNLRSTLGFVADPANSSFAPSALYSSGPTGYINTTSFPTDNNNTTQPANLAGNHNLSSLGSHFRVNWPAGNLGIRIGCNAQGVAARQSFCIWDGDLADGATSVAAGNLFAYLASTAVALNRYTVVGDKLYKCTTAGVTGAASPPAGTGSGIVDGSAVWAWVKTALATADSVANVPNGSVMSAAGIAHTYATFLANNAPIFITTTQAFFTVTRGQLASVNLRYVAVESQATPLQPLTFRDTFGAPVENPVVYAQEPENFPDLELQILAGSTNPNAFTFGGSLGIYYKAMILNGKVYAVRNAARMPDSLAGAQTLTVIQTDNSPTISGSPFVTMLGNCTVVSSNGRAPSTPVLDKISTRAWLARNVILAAHVGKWPGYQGQAFVSDQIVNGDADFVAKWNAINPDGASWYRLRFAAGVYTGLIYPDSKNFGTGGILLEPNGADDPALNFIIASNFVVRGLHVRNLKQPMVLPGGAFYAWTFSFGGGFSLRARFENMRFGAMFDPSVTEATLTTVPNQVVTPFQTSQGEQLDIINCVFDGCAQAIGIVGIRLAEIRGNRCLRGSDDFLAYTLQSNLLAPIGVLADDNMYLILADNVDHREIDYPGFTTTAHRDTIGGQIRPNLDSPYGAMRINSKAPVAWAVGNRTYLGNAWYVVAAITTGIAGVTPPSGIANGQVDGGVTWNYGGVHNPNRRLHVLVENSSQNSVRSISGDIADGQFLIDSSNDYGDSSAFLDLVVINNIAAGASGFGMSVVSRGSTYVECNTFVGPSSIQAGNNAVAKFITFAQFTKGYAANNIVGQAPIGVAEAFGSYNNVIASFASTAVGATLPGNVMTGPFVQDGTNRWGYNLADSSDISRFELRERMKVPLSALSGINAGFADPVAPPSGISDSGNSSTNFQLTAGQIRF